MRAEAISSGGLSKGGNDGEPGGCHQEGRGSWCQKQVQVLNAIFRPVVGKISSPFLGDRVPAGVQEEEVFNNVTESVRQAVRTFRIQYRYFY